LQARVLLGTQRSKIKKGALNINFAPLLTFN